MFKRVTKKQCSIARQRADVLLRDVQKKLKDKYKFAVRMVGSGAWGTMIEDDKGEFDLDYQILLSKNSPVYKKNNAFSTPTEIKNEFYSAFKKCLKGKEDIENSTTAITLINKDGKPYHIDIVIIRTLPENNFIIRRNNKKETPQHNEFTWNKLPKWKDAYNYFRSLPPKEKQYLIEKIIIPKKQIEKAKAENDPSKISSSELFVREVNNYKCQPKKK